MVILRSTRKLRELTPEALDPALQSDTALGDWYVNRLVGKTADRSVLGTLVEFARMTPYYLPEGSWGDHSLLEAKWGRFEAPQEGAH